ncbi:O-antigen polymerase [Streptococcus ruminantium]|uniref:O-antigen polymerase n=1 Tax=Streptococcus ruminantium TaxID=1917441 RepID=UPI0012DF5793|nr:O-antigen polymerase [Streptococcus ruminantium]
MSILLCLIILLLVYFYFLSVKKDLSNPGIINLAIWLFASLGTIHFSNRWGTPLSFATLIILVSGLVMFSTGVLSSSLIVRTSNKNHLIKLPPVSMLFFVIVVIFFIFSYQILSDDAFRVATYYSQLSGKPLSSDLFTAIERARYMITNYDYSFSKGTANLLRANYSLGILAFTYFCQEFFYGKKLSHKILFLIISLWTLFISLLSTGRTELLGLVSGYFVIFTLYYSFKYIWSGIESSGKLLKIILLYGLGSIGLFLLVGEFVLSRLGNSPIDNLSKYIGSPIAGLDYFIKNQNFYAENRYFGENTFIAIYGTLKSLGIFPERLSPFLPIINFYGTTSNVYTAYYVFIKDFGYFIAVVVQFLYGLFFGTMYYIIKKNLFSPLLIMLYGLLSYGMVIMFFQEAFVTLLTTHIIRAVFLFMWFLLIKILSVFKLKRYR